MNVDQRAHGGRETIGRLEFLGQSDGGPAIERFSDDGTAVRLISRPAELQPVLEIIGNHLLAARAAGFARPLESSHGH